MVGGAAVRYRRSALERLAELVIIVVLAAAALVTIFPLIYVFNNSISGSAEILGGTVWLWPRNVTWNGYLTVVQSTEVWRSYYNTLWYTGVGTALNVSITLMVAYPLSRRAFNGRGLLMFYIAFTMWFSGGIIPTFIIVRNLGLYATRWAMVLPTAAAAWNIIITRTYLQSNIDDSIPESAKIDGANDLTIFFRIVIPVSSTIIAVNVLFYAVAHWNAYFPALIYLPDPDLHPLQMILRKFLILPPEEEELMAFEAIAGVTRNRFVVIMVGTLPILAVYPFLQRYFIKGVMIGALKG